MRRAIVVTAVAGLVWTASIGPATASAPTKKNRPLRVMVTNDDGVGAPGIDTLVEALEELPKVRVTIIAPATDQTGSASKSSPSPHTSTGAQTASGHEATAVDGSPADTVTFAFDERGLEFDLVVSGINAGQNLGPGADLSGTVGAVKAAAAHGVPALAVSQGIYAEPDFEAAAREAVRWVKRHRKALLKAKGRGATEATSLNVPTCLTGEVRGVVEVPRAGSGDYILAADRVDCESTLEDPPDDITAFNNGFATLSAISPG